MSKRSMTVWTAVGAMLFGGIVTTSPAAAASQLGSPAGRTAPAPRAPATAPRAPAAAPRAPAAALAAVAPTPAQAVAEARSESAANGITDYVSVVDTNTGAVLAQSSNAGTQVASESIVKLMIAAYYLVLVGGYTHQSGSVLSQLSYMIRYSDDATASAYFTSAAVPTIAARYGMGSTINATDRVGHWGAVRITAHDMTTFLYRAFHDPEVGPWLGPVMTQVAPVGSDGFNQAFGMNSLGGTHGSKQGWGDDQFWSPANNVINSVGFTDRYFVAILQNSYSYPDPARATSTFAARAIQASRPPVVAPPGPPAPPREGDFVTSAAAPGVYRVVGGAPVFVSSWAPYGRPQQVKTISVTQWRALRPWPANGTFIKASATGQVYRVAGGAPLYVSNWAQFGGVKPTQTVDIAAIAHAGQPGVWAHLRSMPVDGTFVTTTAHQTFRIVAGTPTFVPSWAHWGRAAPSTLVDAADVTNAGRPGVWAHLRNTLPDNTFIVGVGSAQVFRMAGGAPIFVPSWSEFGGQKPVQFVDADAIKYAGSPSQWSHLRSVPVNGTLITSYGGATYRIAGGAPLYIRPLPVLHAATPVVMVSLAAITHTSAPGVWSHLHQYPVDNTILQGIPGNRFYRVAGGHATQIGPAAGAVGINQTTIQMAGAGFYYNHLKK